MRLKKQVERVKLALSSSMEATIQIDSLLEGFDFEFSIARSCFEEVNVDLFWKCMECVEKCLRDARMSKKDVQEVVLIGGSSRIPKVQQLLVDFFENASILNRSINPDEAVVCGAALQNGVHNGNSGLFGRWDNFLVLEVTPNSFGLETAGGVMTIMISRNSTLPTMREHLFTTFSDNQLGMLFEVYEGERARTRDNLLVAKFALPEIPRAPRGVPRILVRFEIDADCSFNVSARDTHSGKECHLFENYGVDYSDFRQSWRIVVPLNESVEKSCTSVTSSSPRSSRPCRTSGYDPNEPPSPSPPSSPRSLPYRTSEYDPNEPPSASWTSPPSGPYRTFGYDPNEPPSLSPPSSPQSLPCQTSEYVPNEPPSASWTSPPSGPYRTSGYDPNEPPSLSSPSSPQKQPYRTSGNDPNESPSGSSTSPSSGPYRTSGYDSNEPASPSRPSDISIRDSYIPCETYVTSCSPRAYESSNTNESGSYEDAVKKYSWDQVQDMTNGLTSTRLGNGGFGTVYLGKLSNGKNVAVKVLDVTSQQGIPEFANEVKLLRRVNHENLVRLLGYCEDLKKVLIYEFAEEGTLWDHLHGKKSRLDWKERLNIALQSACGLEYLHTGCSPTIYHRDIKSENILITRRMVAKVADFGISKVGSDQDNIRRTHVTTMIKGTLGYLDPEYLRTCQLIEKSDVYSFGVLLLEITTGRKPIQNSEKITSVIDWVTKQKGKAVADPFFEGNFNPKALKHVLNVAKQCTQASGADRPVMKKVVRMLETAQAIEADEKKIILVLDIMDLIWFWISRLPLESLQCKLSGRAFLFSGMK